MTATPGFKLVGDPVTPQVVLMDHDVEVCAIPAGYVDEVREMVRLYNESLEPAEGYPPDWLEANVHWNPETKECHIDAPESLRSYLCTEGRIAGMCIAAMRGAAGALRGIIGAVHTGGWHQGLRDRMGALSTIMAATARQVEDSAIKEKGVLTSPVLEGMIPAIQRALFADMAIAAPLKCSVCDTDVDVTKFKDQDSRAEWDITHMCQTCQDNAYRGPDAEA